MIRQLFRQANKSALTGETIPLRALQARFFTVQGKGTCPRLGKPSPCRSPPGQGRAPTPRSVSLRLTGEYFRAPCSLLLAVPQSRHPSW